MKNKIEIYTDGSSLGNPGQGGWGIVVLKNGKMAKEIGGYEKETTNNRMEMMAGIQAIKYLLEEKTKEPVTIFADSSYLILGITSWINNWQKNNWRTANKKPVLNQDLWKELLRLTEEYSGKLSWQKVKGHSGDDHNDRADEIAVNCASSQKNHLK